MVRSSRLVCPLLLSFSVTPGFSSRANAGETVAVNDSLKPWPVFQNLFAERKTCASVLGSWAHAGRVSTGAELVGEPVEQQFDYAGWQGSSQQVCPEQGFSVREHGDRLNKVDIVGDGRFLYVAGDEPGTGAGATICDIDSRPTALDYVFTEGLVGCMGLAIIGRRKGDHGQRDVFFAHQRKWSEYAYNPHIPSNDPLHAAQEFVRCHEDLSVFYGSGLLLNQENVLKTKIYHDSVDETQEEARLLSNILGIWVTDDAFHNKPFAGDLAFSFRHMAWVPLSGTEEKVKYLDDNEAGMQELLVSPSFTPSMHLLHRLATFKSSSEASLQRCTDILRACASGDFTTINSLYSNTKTPYSDLDKGELATYLKACYADMESKGYKDLVSKRFELQTNPAVGRHKVSTPKFSINKNRQISTEW